MKTTLQEHIKELESMLENEHYEIAKQAITNCLICANSYLETEKQQHEKIAIDMINIALDNLNNPNCKMEYEFNKYYNSTFKN